MKSGAFDSISAPARAVPATRLPERNTKRYVALVLLLLAGSYGLSFACLHHGWVHPEAEGFIPHYLSKRPLPELIFDPQHTDWNNYQGRELSYVFDWLDCHFIAACTKWHLPHFLSLTHFLLVGVIALILFNFSRHDCDLHPSVALGLTAIWLTSPVVLFGANFYRSAKITAAAALLLVLVGACRRRPTKANLPTIALAALTAALCDRQGYFIVLFIFAWMAWKAIGGRSRRAGAIAAAVGASTLVAQLYVTFIGPWLIQRFSGQPPDMEFLRLPWPQLASSPELRHQVFLRAPLSGLEALGIQFGRLPAIVVGVSLAIAAWSLSAVADSNQSMLSRWRPVAWRLAPLAAVLLLNMGMALRQPNVVQLELFKRIYFPLPTTACLLVAAALIASAVLSRNWFRPRTVACVFATLALSNLVSLPSHRYVYATSAYRAAIASGPAHIDALRSARASQDANPAVQALLRIDEPPSANDVRPSSPLR